MKQAKRLDRLSASAWYFISESYYKRITDFIKEAERNPDLLNTTKNLPADYGAISVMAEMLTKSYLMGLDRSTRKMEFAEPTAEEIETLPYAEAVEYLKKRDVLTKVDYKKLTAQLKFRAFTASRISDGALLKRINGELIKSIESGEGLKAFLEMTKTDLLNKVGLGNAGGWYWETVYRTNVQTAYNAGRMMGYEQDKPYALELVVIDDARTTEYCRQYAGKGFILPYSDPFWRTHIPPFHFNCRTTIRAIYDQDELPESWSSKTDLARPAKGFGKNPVMNDDWWKELDSQVRQAKMYGVQGEIERAKSILIKNLEIDDLKLMASANDIKQEVIDVIAAVIKPYEKRMDFYINDFSIKSIPATDKGIPLLQIDPTADYTLVLNINKDLVAGRTVEEIDKLLAQTDFNLAKNFKEAIIHECGHAKAIKRMTIKQIEALYEELDQIHLEGISEIAYKDGAEALAEIEILLSRNQDIPEEFIDFYKAYMER